MGKIIKGKTFSKEEIEEYIARENPTPPTPDKRFVPGKSRPVGNVKGKGKTKGVEGQLPHPDEGAFLGKHRPLLACHIPSGKTKDGVPSKPLESLDEFAEGYTGVNAASPPDPISDEQIDYVRSLKEDLEQDLEAFPGERASITSRLEYVKAELAEMLLIRFNRFPKHWLSEVKPFLVRAGLSELQRKIVYLTLVGKDRKQIKNFVKKDQSTITRNKKDAYHKLCMVSVPSGSERQIWFTVLRVINTNRRRGRPYGRLPSKPLGKTTLISRQHKSREKQEPREGDTKLDRLLRLRRVRKTLRKLGPE